MSEPTIRGRSRRRPGPAWGLAILLVAIGALLGSTAGPLATEGAHAADARSMDVIGAGGHRLEVFIPGCGADVPNRTPVVIQDRGEHPVLTGTLTIGGEAHQIGSFNFGSSQLHQFPTRSEAMPITVTVDGASNTMINPCHHDPSAPLPSAGYWLVEGSGRVDAFGLAGDLCHGPVGPVDIEPTASGDGYWVVDAVGSIFPCGDATSFYTRTFIRPTLRPGERVTSLAGTPSGRGLWLFTDVGRVITLGDARSFGDMSKVRLNRPVVDSAATTSGKGYWMLAADGGIFTFGDATFEGSTGAQGLPSPAFAIELDRDGRGYWILTRDGRVHPFAAGDFGSMAGRRLNAPIIGLSSSPTGKGYWQVGADGGVFTFGDAKFVGSAGSVQLQSQVVAFAARR